MASLYLMGVMDVDYYISGKIKSVELANGTVLYDEAKSIAVPNWRYRLWELVVQYRLDQDLDGHGLWAFVYPLIEEFGNADG